MFKDFLIFLIKNLLVAIKLLLFAVIVSYNAESSLFVTDQSERHTVKIIKYFSSKIKVKKIGRRTDQVDAM